MQSDLFTVFFSSKDIQRNIMYFKGCVKDCLFGNQITGWLVPLRHQKFLKLSVKLSVPYLVLALCHTLAFVSGLTIVLPSWEKMLQLQVSEEVLAKST